MAINDKFPGDSKDLVWGEMSGAEQKKIFKNDEMKSIIDELKLNREPDCLPLPDEVLRKAAKELLGEPDKTE